MCFLLAFLRLLSVAGIKGVGYFLAVMYLEEQGSVVQEHLTAQE